MIVDNDHGPNFVLEDLFTGKLVAIIDWSFMEELIDPVDVNEPNFEDNDLERFDLSFARQGFLCFKRENYDKI